MMMWHSTHCTLITIVRAGPSLGGNATEALPDAVSDALPDTLPQKRNQPGTVTPACDGLELCNPHMPKVVTHGVTPHFHLETL
jgi:hypothetical protein